MKFFRFIWGSPPCQKFVSVNLKRKTNHPNLISKTRKLLSYSKKPYVLENVRNAPIRRDLVLCGTMFNLGVFRHRYFEISGFACQQPKHFKHRGRLGDGKYFQNFGLNQFFLYVQPSSYHNFNIKNLLSDNFQSLKYPANLTKNSPLFIKYLIPSHNPNKHYSDSIKSNTLIREYCSFFIKKVYQIFHIDHNLSNDGWELNSNQFKNYLQKILFDPNFTMHILNNRTFSFENLNPPNFYGPKSNEYQDFFDLYNKKPTDIKTFLGTSKTNVVNKILNLFKKDLIFPFIKLKNLNLIERMYFIIPNIKPEFHNLIRKIFNYFNFGFIYEIEGKYFIEGFPNEIQFENGLFIKFCLPEFEMNQFLNLFDLLFEYLKIEDYVILMDLINGDNLVKKIIKDFSYKNHNPLSNLEWDNQTKVWKRLKKKEDTLKH